MDANVRRTRKHDPRQSGQVLVFFILIMVTCLLIALVAVTVGQVLVRRHQAQLVVDAAAFAGASAQAEGLNTIANLNSLSLFTLNAIQVSVLAPYFDNDSTTWIRLGSGTASLAINNWVQDTLEGYQEIFGFYDGLIDLANCAYASRALAQLAARDVVDENFGDGRIFVEDDLGSQGLADPLEWAEANLVELTDPEEYAIGPHYYLPYPANSIASQIPFGAIYAYGIYLGTIDSFIFLQKWASPNTYELGRFYDNEEGDDVRFAYYLTVSQSPVIFGKSFFDDIPPITVAAAAKPYGGYLGDKFEDGNILGGGWTKSMPWPFDDLSWLPIGKFTREEDGKEISATYKAKFVPLTTGEAAGVMIQNPSFEDADRWVTILH
jgi:hypothetical protein